MQRGEIYLVDLGKMIGREQRDRRPVLVVSSDDINRKPLVITVVPGTDGARTPVNYDCNVRVPAGEGGLSKETVFLCFQLRALDHSRFPQSPIGKLSVSRMLEVDEALRFSLDLG